MDLERLFEAAQHGERSAFEQICNQFESDLRGFIHSRMSPQLRQHVDVEDVLQETFLQATESMVRVKWQNERALLGWFCGIAQNLIRTHARRFLKVNFLPDEFDGRDEHIPSPSQALRRSERFDRLRTALTQLTDEQQQIVRLTRIEGMSIRRAAEQMNRSEAASYQLLWRALKRLKTAFGDTGSLQLPPDCDLKNAYDQE